MDRPNDYNQYLEIAADETPVKSVADTYFTATFLRYNEKTGEAENLVVTVRRPELRQYYAYLKAKMEEIEATYDDFGLDLLAIIAAEEAAAAEGGEGEI